MPLSPPNWQATVIVSKISPSASAAPTPTSPQSSRHSPTRQTSSTRSMSHARASSPWSSYPRSTRLPWIATTPRASRPPMSPLSPRTVGAPEKLAGANSKPTPTTRQAAATVTRTQKTDCGHGHDNSATSSARRIALWRSSATKHTVGSRDGHRRWSELARVVSGLARHISLGQYRSHCGRACGIARTLCGRHWPTARTCPRRMRQVRPS